MQSRYQPNQTVNGRQVQNLHSLLFFVFGLGSSAEESIELRTNDQQIRWPDPFFPKLALSRLTTQQFASLSGSTALFIHFQSLGEAPVDEAIPASYCKPKYAKAGGGCRMNQYNFLLLIRMPLRRFSLLLLHCS